MCLYEVAVTVCFVRSTNACLGYHQACRNDFSLLLEADTFSAVMSLFSKKDHLAQWRSDATIRGQIEGAAFDLLGSLSGASSKACKAVGAAETIEACTSRAVDIVVSMFGEKSDDADDASDDDEKEEKKIVDTGTIENIDLCASAMSFLAALVPLPAIRSELAGNEDFVKASAALVKTKSRLELEYQAVKLMSALAPYATSEHALSTGLVAEVLEHVIKTEREAVKGTAGDVNTNLLFGEAVRGIHVASNSLPSDTQLAIAQSIVALFSKTVKSVTHARGDKTNGASLAYNMTLMLLSARGKDSTDAAFTGQLMTSLIHMVQWRYDPKTKLDVSDAPLWSASVTNCLQILSLTLMTTEERLVQAGIMNKSELANTPLMVARPGKAPRKAIDLVSALDKAAQGSDAAASVAAQTVKALLG